MTVLLIACGTPSNPTIKFRKNAAVIIKSNIAEVFIVVGRALQHVVSGRLRAERELFGLILARLDISGPEFDPG